MNNPTRNGRAGRPVLTVEINIGNDACESYDDALNVLEYTARRINDGRQPAIVNDGPAGYVAWSVRDDNGNTIGHIAYDERRPAIVSREVQS